VQCAHNKQRTYILLIICQIKLLASPAGHQRRAAPRCRRIRRCLGMLGSRRRRRSRASACRGPTAARPIEQLGAIELLQGIVETTLTLDLDGLLRNPLLGQIQERRPDAQVRSSARQLHSMRSGSPQAAWKLNTHPNLRHPRAHGKRASHTLWLPLARGHPRLCQKTQRATAIMVPAQHAFARARNHQRLHGVLRDVRPAGPHPSPPQTAGPDNLGRGRIRPRPILFG